MPIDKNYPKKSNDKNMKDKSLEHMDKNPQNDIPAEENPAENTDVCMREAAERGFEQTAKIRCDQEGQTGAQDTTHEKQKVTAKEPQVRQSKEETDEKSWKKYDWEE